MWLAPLESIKLTCRFERVATGGLAELAEVVSALPMMVAREPGLIAPVREADETVTKGTEGGSFVMLKAGMTVFERAKAGYVRGDVAGGARLTETVPAPRPGDPLRALRATLKVSESAAVVSEATISQTAIPVPFVT